MRRKKHISALRHFSWIGALFVLIGLHTVNKPRTQFERVRRARGPAITITQIPPRGAGSDVMETITGAISGIDSKDVRVVLFARTNVWYVQPYAVSPYTSINDDGKWEAKTHLGDEYAALLVEPSYQPPVTTETLPEIAGTVLAIARVGARIQPEQNGIVANNDTKKPRSIEFSGYAWKVKSSIGRVGPGPNHFSDTNDNVEVDSRGRLHLRITKRDGRWYCAEVISTRSFGYGTYRFYLDTQLSNIDPRVVLGMLTWSDDPAFSHREIDIEMSRWGKVDNQNAQFVIQPYTRPMNIVRFDVPLQIKKTVHAFLWKRGNVLCESVRVVDEANARTNPLIQQHTFVSDIPEPGGENARINLWLTDGDSIADLGQTEIIVSKFEFVPWK